MLSCACAETKSVNFTAVTSTPGPGGFLRDTMNRQVIVHMELYSTLAVNPQHIKAFTMSHASFQYRDYYVSASLIDFRSISPHLERPTP